MSSHESSVSAPHSITDALGDAPGSETTYAGEVWSPHDGRGADADASGRARLGTLALWSLKLGVLLALCRKPPFLAVDSHSYLSHHILRTPGYPLFLDLMRLGGGAYFLKLAQVVQVLLGMLMAHVLSRALWSVVRGERRRGALPQAVLFLLLCIPLFRCGEVIITETLSYAAFLLLCTTLLRVFVAPARASLAPSAAAIFLLLLLRPQFLFALPLLGLVGVWLLARQPSLRTCLHVLVLLLGIGGAALCQASYTAVHHGVFARVPATGLQLLTVLLYLAEPHDSAGTRAEADDGRFLRSLQDRLAERHLSSQARPPELPPSVHFNQVYNAICYGTIVAEYQDLRGVAELSPADWIALDRLTMGLSLRLLRGNAARLGRHILKEIQEAGGYLPLFMILLSGLGFVAYVRTGGPAGLFLGAVGLLGLSNYLLVALVEPLGVRYLLYTENVQAPALCSFVLSLLPAGASHVRHRG